MMMEATKRLECDLVMKGGITSGVVYPPAVLELYKAGYHFRSIGGTSAGAIAAGVTAAAEFGREHDGFGRLREVNQQIVTPGFLPSLFRPSTPEMQALFDTLRAGARPSSSWLGKAGAVLGSLRPWGAILGGAAAGFLTGSVPVGAAEALSGGGGAGTVPGALTAGVLGAAVGAAIGAAAGSALSLRGLIWTDLPKTLYGMCLGHAAGAAARREGELTDWLAWAVDYTAGRVDDGVVPEGAAPLTFGELESRGVQLRMMTSDVSEQRPYAIPFPRRDFLFHEEEMARLFPAYVVEHLVRHAHRSGSAEERSLPPGFHFMPDPADLPVVVGMRMSLSFPLLISAVPLYRMAAEGWAKVHAGSGLDPDTDLTRHWFSDGGISSNFPIHFFDSWVPSRPTFGITLVEAPEGAPLPPIRLPVPNPAHAPDTAKPIGSLAGFLAAIWGTAQNYRDSLQSQLPSYRERIIPIPLAPTEGGLNLEMSAETLKAVMARGEEAGRALAGFDFDHHLWVRYLVLLSELEANFAVLRERMGPEAARFRELLQRQREADSAYPYARAEEWCTSAEARLNGLAAAIRDWDESLFSAESPRPRGKLRVEPDV